jgi:CubicO group peptidase (beta-lactamase class C family)
MFQGASMRLFHSRLAVCLSFAALLLVSPNARAQKKEELPHPKTLQELQKAMKDVVDKAHLPGAGVALVSNGELLWCGGLGKADLASGRDITCDTEFRVGSISKTFVSLALLKLQEEGKINIEARLQDVAPEIPVKNRWESTNPVRIVNLLEHTAGFDDMEPPEVYNFSDSYDYPLLEVFKRFTEPEDVRWPPSTRMSYSNPGFGIAGYLIEKTAGKPYDLYIRETILRPLGMNNADFPFTDANKALLATGYDNLQHAVGYPYIYLRPAGDLKASPGELAKLVQFFLRRGKASDTQLLKPESIMRMESVESTLAAKNGLRLGYGLANYTKVDGGVVTHGHDGGIDGFISSYRYMPEQNWGYVALLNSVQPGAGEALGNLNTLAIDFLSKDFPKPQLAAVSIPASDLEKFAGYYSPRAPRTQLIAFLEDLAGGLRVRVINGQLTRSGLFGKPETMIPVGKNLFRGEKEPEATTIFVADESGEMALSSIGMEGFSYGVRGNILWTYTRICLLVLCAVLMATSLLFAIVWVLRKLFGGMKGVQHLSVRVVPLLATICFLGMAFCLSKLGGSDSGKLTLWTGGAFALSLLFPLLSVYGLFLAARVPKNEIKGGTRIHSLLVALACCVLTLFIGSWHLIGLRLWAP